MKTRRAPHLRRRRKQFPRSNDRVAETLLNCGSPSFILTKPAH